MMSAAVTVAIISGLVAILSVVFSSYATVHTMRIRDSLEGKREQASRISAIEDVMARYRNPLVRASFDLQGRIHSILNVQFMSRHLGGNEDERAYATASTLFRLAEYFGWMEILRRGVQFLDLGNQERNKELSSMLQRISLAFANTHQYPDSAFRLFRDEQRAIGELVLESLPDDPLGYRCLGYARFVQLLEDDANFARWFKTLQNDVLRMEDPPPGYMDRLREVNGRLADLLNFLDPEGVRYLTAETADPLGAAMAGSKSASDAPPETTATVT